MAATKRDAEKQARDIVNNWAVGAIGIAWIPGSSVALTAGEVAMIAKVAECFAVTEYRTEAVLGAVGGAVAGQTASEFLSFIPVVGWAVKSAIASGVVKTIGETVITYFRDCSSLPE